MSGDVLDEMRAFGAQRGPRCALCRLMDEMTPEHRELCQRGIATLGITDEMVALWVADKGYTWDISNPKACVTYHRQSRHGE